MVVKWTKPTSQGCEDNACKSLIMLLSQGLMNDSAIIIIVIARKSLRDHLQTFHYRCGAQGSEKLRNLSDVTQHVRGRTGTRTWCPCSQATALPTALPRNPWFGGEGGKGGRSTEGRQDNHRCQPACCSHPSPHQELLESFSWFLHIKVKETGFRQSTWRDRCGGRALWES